MNRRFTRRRRGGPIVRAVMRRLAVLSLAALVAVAGCAAGGGEDTSAGGTGTRDGGPVPVDGAALDRLLADTVATTTAPGAAAAVVVRGRVAWSGAAGEAAQGVPVRPGTRFITASTAKVVTAAMVMRLAAAGEVDLDAPVARYGVPVPSADRVTVRMLLSHRSGLGDYLAAPAVLAHIQDRPLEPWTRDEALAGAAAPTAPGSAFAYSNTNYVALGAVLEAAGEGPEGELRDMVAPIGLSRTSFRREDPPGPDLARPHGPAVPDLPGGRIAADVWGPVWTDGGLATTAPELARFLDALMRDRLLPAGVAARMVPAAGEPYGLGLIAGNRDGVRWIGHDGAYGGYTSQVWHAPALGVTFAVLANSDEADGQVLPAQAIARAIGARIMRDAR